METEHTYIVATIKPWNIKIFENRISQYPGKWLLITEPSQLTRELILQEKPRYIFFPHWSWVVPKEILEAAECVCFHETDVPYGRGCSPIQNLIIRGAKTTKISALQMEAGLDTGPVYMKRDVSLEGSAQEIFERIAPIVADMIREIAATEPKPKPQVGEPVVFKRRTPEEGNLVLVGSEPLEKMYDVIRMLDAESYPHAYLAVGKLRLEFTNAEYKKGTLTAKVTIQNHD